MALLLEDDYEYLREIGQIFEEDENNRLLILRNVDLPSGQYVRDGGPASSVDVIFKIPQNYNYAGPDMFWVHPPVQLANGQPIPQAHNGCEPLTHAGVTFERWSRHWNHLPWKSREDGMATIMDRLTWALRYPDPRNRHG